jgi:hypothetical protein
MNKLGLPILLFTAVSAVGCTETHKAWKRDDTPSEVVERQKDLCTEYADGLGAVASRDVGRRKGRGQGANRRVTSVAA